MSVRTGTITVSALRDPDGNPFDVAGRLIALEQTAQAPPVPGPQGPPGADGAQGIQGVPGPGFAATVSATSATIGTMTVAMGEGARTIAPTGACTFNASGGVAGQRCTFLITTVGTTSRVLTWSTNFRKAGTLATGTAAARFFSVTFVCADGTVWQETGRTAVQT
jgi:hypothetical protein